MGQQAEKGKTERVIGLGRRTREEVVKWNQMTALRFQTGGETSDIPGLPSGFPDRVRKRKRGRDRQSETERERQTETETDRRAARYKRGKLTGV